MEPGTYDYLTWKLRYLDYTTWMVQYIAKRYGGDNWQHEITYPWGVRMAEAKGVPYRHTRDRARNLLQDMSATEQRATLEYLIENAPQVALIALTVGSRYNWENADGSRQGQEEEHPEGIHGQAD